MSRTSLWGAGSTAVTGSADGGRSRHAAGAQDRRPVIIPAFLPEELAAGEKTPGAGLRLWRRGNPRELELSTVARILGMKRSFTRSFEPDYRGPYLLDCESEIRRPGEGEDRGPEGVVGLVQVATREVRAAWLRPGMRVAIMRSGSAFVGVIHACDGDGVCLRTPDGFMPEWCYPDLMQAALWVQFMGSPEDRIPASWSVPDFLAQLRQHAPSHDPYPDLGQHG